jgi:hypothetical protein
VCRVCFGPFGVKSSKPEIGQAGHREVVYEYMALNIFVQSVVYPSEVGSSEIAFFGRLSLCSSFTAGSQLCEVLRIDRAYNYLNR